MVGRISHLVVACPGREPPEAASESLVESGFAVVRKKPVDGGGNAVLEGSVGFPVDWVDDGLCRYE
jgi:hypothetical protein